MMDRKDLEPMTAERAREIAASARPNIFNELIHSTNTIRDWDLSLCLVFGAL